MPKKFILALTRGGVIAAIYVLLTVPLGALSFGVPVGPFAIQFRPAEALTLLPILLPEAVPAVFVGVLIANLVSQFGWLDVVFGSLITLVAAVVTRRARGSIVAWLSPVIFNALFISVYVAWMITDEWGTLTYWTAYGVNALSIAISQAMVIFLLGGPLMRLVGRYLEKN